MSFASPVWLLFLVPWGALVVWMLLGERQRVAVPFLALWSGPAGGPKRRRALARPPIALACALAALLCAIAGASGPTISFGRWGAKVVLILDRGVTMSAGDRR